MKEFEDPAGLLGGDLINSPRAAQIVSDNVSDRLTIDIDLQMRQRHCRRWANAATRALMIARGTRHAQSGASKPPADLLVLRVTVQPARGQTCDPSR